ncbi:hypothetical protein [Paenibacillus tepidiphilus]|uniref:hypothetical protein n=1 Tax=Paenibacillus tepidiphilus TaxID=2608683 RepID=UPI001239FDC8|nr:hypothetical protein [Paenibacillus tepidiphilus]
MKKTLALLLTALLLVTGVFLPYGTGQAAAAKAPVYTELATFIDGKLQTSPVKSLLANGSTYIPVKLAQQIPGITADTSAGVTLTGGKGAAKLDATNSILYKNSNYVSFKTLLKIGNLEGKYASSAEAIFLWTTEEGKTKSNATLSSISKLPGTMGLAVGKKVYVFGFPDYSWVLDVDYDGGSTMVFTLQHMDGTIWTLDDPVYGTESLYTDAYLQGLKSTYYGLTAWVNNSIIEDSPFTNMEKVTLLNVLPDPDHSAVKVQVRRANGEEFYMTTDPEGDIEEEIDQYFYFKNPRTVYKISDKMWKAIQEERVVVGMSFEEVYFAWGEPDRTNDSLGLVVYGNTYLYFRNDKLATIL